MTKAGTLTGISIAIIALLTILDFKALRYGFNCIREASNAPQYEIFGLNLCMGNFLFKLTGFILVAVGLIEFFKKPKSLNLKLKLLLIYTVVAIILTLPLYHRHHGFGGSEKHGHSFWNGGLHFH